MKLSEGQRIAMQNTTRDVVKFKDDDIMLGSMLQVMCETCISIGVEIAMQHRHVMREHEGVVLHTGPAEAIDHGR